MKISQKVLTDLKNRQEYAFEIVYQEYYRLIYYISFRIVKDEELAKDIMQETFLSLMEHIEEYNESGTLKSYLTSIAKNKSLNAIQKTRGKSISTRKAKTDWSAEVPPTMSTLF